MIQRSPRGERAHDTKDGTDDNDNETQTLTGTSQSELEREQDGGQDGPSRKFDDAVQGTADADVPGSVRTDGDAGRSGEPELLGLPAISDRCLRVGIDQLQNADASAC